MPASWPRIRLAAADALRGHHNSLLMKATVGRLLLACVHVLVHVGVVWGALRLAQVDPAALLHHTSVRLPHRLDLRG